MPTKVERTTGTEERGVSPVIGVILLVAITVILAAVIAAAVMGMGDDLSGGAQAGVVVEQQDDVVYIEIQSGGNADDFKIGGDTDYSGDDLENASGELNDVGDTLRISNDDSNGDYNVLDDSGTVTIIAVTDSGDETVVASVDYEF